MPKALRRGEAGTRCRRRYSGEKLEPDAESVTAGTGTTPAAFYLGLCRLRGIQSPPASATASCRRNRSPLRQRRIESDAEFCRGGDCRHSGGFLLRAMPPSWHPVPACVRYGILQAKPFSLAAAKNRIGRGPRCRYDRSRRNHSLLPQRKLESDADLVAATTTAGGPFLTAAARTLHQFQSLALKSRIDAHRRA